MEAQGINWDALVTAATLAIAVWLLLGNVLAWLWGVLGNVLTSLVRPIRFALRFVYFFITDPGPAPASAPAAAAPRPQLSPASVWGELGDDEAAPAADVLGVLDESLHALLIGYSGGGKTTLMHELAQRWTQRASVLVCDPDAAPGLWAGCDVAGAGDDYEGIGAALARVGQLVATRRRARAAGVRTFAPLYVCIDEYQDVARNVEQARAVVEDVLRRGRKLGVHLVIGVQDKAVKTLGFEGQGDLRRNFTWIAELRQRADGTREARLQANGDGGWVTLPVPELPDLDALIDQAAGDEVVSVSTRGVVFSVDTSDISDTNTDDRRYDEAVRLAREEPHLSANKIYERVGGNRNLVLARIAEVRQRAKV
jgi:hypothetical protein